MKAKVTGVWIVGHDSFPVALFRYREHAEEWARQNYAWQWLLKEFDTKLPTLATKQQWKKAEKRGAGLIKKLQCNQRN